MTGAARQMTPHERAALSRRRWNALNPTYARLQQQAKAADRRFRAAVGALLIARADAGEFDVPFPPSRTSKPGKLAPDAEADLTAQVDAAKAELNHVLADLALWDAGMTSPELNAWRST